jgi:hypothetical protein
MQPQLAALDTYSEYADGAQDDERRCILLVMLHFSRVRHNSAHMVLHLMREAVLQNTDDMFFQLPAHSESAGC